MFQQQTARKKRPIEDGQFYPLNHNHTKKKFATIQTGKPWLKRGGKGGCKIERFDLVKGGVILLEKVSG